MTKCTCRYCGRRFDEDEVYVGPDESLDTFCDWQCYEDYSTGPTDLDAAMMSTVKNTRRQFEARELQTARLEIRLPPALIQALRGEAERAGVSVAWIVKEGIYQALAQKECTQKLEDKMLEAIRAFVERIISKYDNDELPLAERLFIRGDDDLYHALMAELAAMEEALKT